MIDVHVHFRDWNQSYKETIYHGLKTFATMGYHMICDMPNTNPPLVDFGTIEKRVIEGIEAEILLKNEFNVDIAYYCYAGLTNDEEQIREMIKVYNQIDRVIGLKYFACHSTGNMGILEESKQDQIYRILAQENYKGMLAVHCEDSKLFKNNIDKDILINHCLQQPIEAEVSSIRKQIEFAIKNKYKGHLHICHLTSVDALETIEKFRKQNLMFKLTCGVTSSHALLSVDTNATKFNKINPPIRFESDRVKLYQAIIDKRIDWIESDHAPHSLEEKEKGFSGAPSCLGQIILLDKLSKDLDEEYLKELYGERVNRELNLNIKIELPNNEKRYSLIKEYRNEYCFDPFSKVQ